MGFLDELKKLTKPYDDEDYLEEDLADPVRVPGQDNRSYASYAEAPRPAEPAQSPRRPYVFSQPPRQQNTPQQGYPQGNYADPYAQQGYAAYAQQAQGQPYATRGYAQQPQGQTYAQQPPRQQGYPQNNYAAAPQAKLLLVQPNRFEMAADIADRIIERNAIVLNLEDTQKDVARRMLDFLSGVTYSQDGKIKKVSGSTYVITPAGMEFMADGVEDMESQENYF